MLKVIWAVKEHNNGKEIAQLRPYAIYFDMIHNFSKCKKPKGIYLRGSDAFIKELNKQPFFSDTSMQPYDIQNPQTLVLWHGIVYNALFKLYIKHITTGFDNYSLSKEKSKYDQNKEIITIREYKRLPKRYRAIFIPYNNNHYVLNVPNTDMTFLYNAKKNRDRLELLLREAQKYIPLIYQEPMPDIDLGGLQVIDMPLRVPDSAAAQRVSDAQIGAIKKLYNIFIAVSKITFPSVVSTPHKDLIYEYLHEKRQQNAVFNAAKHKQEIYKKIKHENYLQSKNTPKKPARVAFKKLKRILKHPQEHMYIGPTIGEQYKDVNEIIMYNLKKQITNTY